MKSIALVVFLVLLFSRLFSDIVYISEDEAYNVRIIKNTKGAISFRWRGKIKTINKRKIKKLIKKPVYETFVKDGKEIEAVRLDDTNKYIIVLNRKNKIVKVPKLVIKEVKLQEKVKFEIETNEPPIKVADTPSHRANNIAKVITLVGQPMYIELNRSISAISDGEGPIQSEVFIGIGYNRLLFSLPFLKFIRRFKPTFGAGVDVMYSYGQVVWLERDSSVYGHISLNSLFVNIYPSVEMRISPKVYGSFMAGIELAFVTIRQYNNYIIQKKSYDFSNGYFAGVGIRYMLDKRIFVGLDIRYGYGDKLCGLKIGINSGVRF